MPCTNPSVMLYFLDRAMALSRKTHWALFMSISTRGCPFLPTTNSRNSLFKLVNGVYNLPCFTLREGVPATGAFMFSLFGSGIHWASGTLKGPPPSRTSPPHFSKPYPRNPDCSVFDATNTHPPIHEEILIHDCADPAPQLATPSVTGTPRIRCPIKGHVCVSESACRMNVP